LPRIVTENWILESFWEEKTLLDAERKLCS